MESLQQSYVFVDHHHSTLQTRTFQSNLRFRVAVCVSGLVELQLLHPTNKIATQRVSKVAHRQWIRESCSALFLNASLVHPVCSNYLSVISRLVCELFFFVILQISSFLWHAHHGSLKLTVVLLYSNVKTVISWFDFSFHGSLTWRRHFKWQNCIKQKKVGSIL